jgi:arylsulfatase A-like enzyme/Flp pilus assembly protein TadD
LLTVRPAIIIAAVAAALCGCGPPSEGPRNVVLISIDTCRADRLGCYGHPGASTPNIDAVARDGVIFLNARTTNPITLPAHSSMMTGTIPPDHGVHDNRTYRLAQSNVTLAEVMREHGLATAAFVGAFPLDSIMGLDQGFEVYDDRYTMGGAGRVANERRAGEVSDAAIEWLRRHDGEPFFLFAHYFDPHSPYSPPEPFASEHPGDPYQGEIAYADAAVGRLLDELKELGLYDPSLIVITSDHGESLGEHGESTHAYFLYGSTMRVPLVMKAPGCVAGREVAEVVSLTDIAPTVLGALGLEPRGSTSGVDLSDHLRARDPESRERPVYGESVVPTVFGCNALRSVVQGDWHYIWSNRPELYDLASDPGEQRDRIEQQPERVAVLHDALVSMLGSHAGGDEAERQIDPEALERLESLGYVGSGHAPSGLDIDPSLTDPKDFIDVYERLAAAKSLRYEGKLDEAKAICEEILEQRPDSLWGNNVAGLVAFDQRRIDEAAAYFSKVVSLLADRQDSSGSGAARRFDFELAEAHDHLGRALILSGDTRAGLEHHDRAVALQPDFAVFRNNLGSALLNLGRLDTALAHLEEAVRLRPTYATARKNLGIALLKGRQWARAREQFETALRLNPGSVDAHYGLGHCLAFLNDFRGAEAEFARVVELDPAHRQARKDLADVRAVLRQQGPRTN